MTPELAKALHAFQKDAPPIHLDSKNPHFGNRYVSLSGVVAAIRPVLNKHGLVYTQLPTLLDGVPALRTSVIHAATGHEVSDVMPLTVSKADAQGYGSALTYARRYALLSILGLVADDDDDATAVSGNTVQARQVASQSVPAGAGDPAPLLAADMTVHFGKNAGTRLADLSEQSLGWYADTWDAGDTEQDLALKRAAVALKHGGKTEADLDDGIPF